MRPGGVIVEGTAGNTGIGLALVGNARGYRTVIVMPETQSQEKKDMLLLCGVDLRLVPAAPYANPKNYVRYSGRLAEEIAAQEPNGAIWANQFDNLANRRGHYETTGPEIWAQTDGKVDGFTCSVGTGGTLSGVGIALKERNPEVQIYLSDPMGSGIYSWYARREFKPEGNSITEGIGNNRETKNLEGFTPDGQYQITDDEALPILFDLVTEEGLVLGGSTGINVCGAIRLARELGPGHTIVTILADSGTRYQSKLFNPEFLKERDLPAPRWLDKANDMTELLFRDDGYPRSCAARVTAGRCARHPARPHRVLPDGRRAAGRHRRVAAGLGRAIAIVDTVKGEAAGRGDPCPGARRGSARARRRAGRRDRLGAAPPADAHAHLPASVVRVVPGAVTGGQVSDGRGRLDFDVPGSSLDKEAIAGAAQCADRRRPPGRRRAGSPTRSSPPSPTGAHDVGKAADAAPAASG